MVRSGARELLSIGGTVTYEKGDKVLYAGTEGIVTEVTEGAIYCVFTVDGVEHPVGFQNERLFGWEKNPVLTKEEK